MPEITPEERGRRAFQLQKERAAENASARIRAGLGQDWKLLSSDDVRILNAALGEAWIRVGRERWGRIAFSGLGKADVETIIDLGKRIQKGEEEGTIIQRMIETLEKLK